MGSGKSKKILMLKGFFFGLQIPSLRKRVKTKLDEIITGLGSVTDAKYCQMALGLVLIHKR